MAKRCRICGHQNGDDRYLCQRCGEFLDDNARVLRHYEQMKREIPHAEQDGKKPEPPRVRIRIQEDEVPAEQESKRIPTAALWALLIAIVAVVGIVAWVLLA